LEETARLTEMALAWSESGRGVALATVVAVEGAAPRPVGSRLIIDDTQRFQGSVSGGCVDAAVIEEAAKVIKSGKPVLMPFGEATDSPWAIGLACGGAIKVLVERLDADLSALYRQMIILGRQRQSAERLIDLPDRSHFTECWNPAPRLLIVGAVHIAQHLNRMAHLADYDVTIIEPRSAFRREEHFPAATLTGLWPDQAIAALQPDADTAVIALTHDTKLDDPAIVAALASEAFYIGALGSRETHKKRLNRLRTAGLSPGQLARIQGPVGIEIGAQSPAEIAISIMAGLTATRRVERIHKRTAE
jgi:xanthine dehydrogenase accessory factor